MKSEEYIESKLEQLEAELNLEQLKVYDSQELQNKKKKQLVNASKFIGDGISQNLIVGVIDSTIFGSGKEGALFTGKSVYIRGFLGSPTALIDLVKLKKVSFSVENEVKDNGNSIKKYQLHVSYDDKENNIVSENETDAKVFNSVVKTLKDFKEHVGNVPLEETDHSVTLVDLGDVAIVRYLEAVYTLLSIDGHFDDHDMRNYAMIQSQLNVSQSVDASMRTYRFRFEKPDLVKSLDDLKEVVPSGSQSTIFQSLLNDILSTFSDEDLEAWNKNDGVIQLITFAKLSKEQTKFFVRNQQLNRRQLTEKITDSEVKKLTSQLAANGASAGASLMALAITGASVGAFGEFGLGSLAFVTMSTGGVGLAVLGIGAASVAAYKGVEYITGADKEKYMYRNELLQAQIMKLSNSQQIIMKDINYLTKKIAGEMSRQDDVEKKLMQAEKFIQKIKLRTQMGTKLESDAEKAKKEQLISNLPETINREKLHELITSHTSENEIESKILEGFDQNNHLRIDRSNRDLALLLNQLENIEYNKPVTLANAKVVGSKAKGAVAGIWKRYVESETTKD